MTVEPTTPMDHDTGGVVAQIDKVCTRKKSPLSWLKAVACCGAASSVADDPTCKKCPSDGLSEDGNLSTDAKCSLVLKPAWQPATVDDITRNKGVGDQDLDDDQEYWWDARSEFSDLAPRHDYDDSGTQLESELLVFKDLQLCSPLTAPIALSAPSWVPDPPLKFAGERTRYLPMPQCTGLHGYWRKNPKLSSPSPLPVDVLFRSGWFCQRTHNSIAWVRVYDVDDVFGVSLKCKVGGAMPTKYRETYPKDSKQCTWMLRRDLRAGRSSGQVFFTNDGQVVVRIYSKSFHSDHIDQIVEEYYQLANEGQRLVCTQYGYDVATNKSAEQVLVGDRMEEVEARE